MPFPSMHGGANIVDEEKACLLNNGGKRYDGESTIDTSANPTTRLRPPPITTRNSSTDINSDEQDVIRRPGSGKATKKSRGSSITDVWRSLSSSRSYTYGPTIHRAGASEEEWRSLTSRSSGNDGSAHMQNWGMGARRQPSQKWQSLDVYQSLAGVTRHPTLAHEGYYNRGANCFFMLWRMMEASILLALTGLLTAVVTLIVNISVFYFAPARYLIVNAMDWKENHLVAASIFTLYVAILSVISALVTNRICPESVGGGIPDVKTVLSGLISTPVLSIRLIWAKMLGLIFALIAGLSVGKEGPFVHVAVAISDSLMRLHCFRHCRRNTSKRLEILGCASAAGVASTFGTPFGGVLFSIEVTATYYMVRNLPRAFFCAICAALVYEIAGLRDTFALFTDDHDRVQGYLVFDLLLCCGLGLLCGLFGALFVGVISALCSLRNRYLSFSLGWPVVARRRVWMVLATALVVAPLIYLDMVSGLPQGGPRPKPLTDYMFRSGIIGVSGPLALYAVFKFLVTALCVSLPLPVGLFTPTFVTGGAVGRLFGEIVHFFYPTDRITSLEPWEFAVIGAAAFSSGVTRAVSTAVIVFELSGQNHLRLPISVALLLAYFVANRFTKNVYDELLDTNGTPSLPELPAELYMVTAAQVMRPVDQGPYLTLSSTFAEAEKVLLRCGGSEWLIPVVDTDESMHLQGAVLAEDLKVAVNGLYVQLHALEDGEEECVRTQPGGSGASHRLGGETGKEFLRRKVTFSDDSEQEKRGSTPQRGSEDEKKGPAEAPDLGVVGGGKDEEGREDHIDLSNSAKSVAMGMPLHIVVLRDRDTVDTLTPSRRRRLSSLSSSKATYLTPPPLIMDPSPYQVGDRTLLSKVDFSFRMLKVTQAYVVRSGRLLGVLTRDSLTEFVGTREKKPMHRCLQLLGSCWDSLCCCFRSRRSKVGEEERSRVPPTNSGSRWSSYQALPRYSVFEEGKKSGGIEHGGAVMERGGGGPSEGTRHQEGDRPECVLNSVL